MYFQHLPDPPWLPYLPSFIFFLSLKKDRQTNQNRRTGINKEIQPIRTIKIKIKKACKKHGIYFDLAHYSRAWSLPWSVVVVFSDTQLEKMHSLFPKRHQSCLLPSPNAVVLSGLNLGKSWVCAVSLCERMCASAPSGVENTIHRLGARFCLWAYSLAATSLP